jgi:hypothetical protein
MCLATALKQGPFIIYQGSGVRKNAKIPIQKMSTLSFDQERLKRPALDQWAIQEITVTDDGVAMAKAIQNGTAIAVSDGSHKDGRGAAAFIFETSNQFQTAGQIVGVNSTPGKTEDQTSYRSELGGVSGIVETVGTLCARHDIKFGAVEVGMDGDQAMKSVFSDWPLCPGQADYDLLKDLQEKTRRSPLKWTGR